MDRHDDSTRTGHSIRNTAARHHGHRRSDNAVGAEDDSHRRDKDRNKARNKIPRSNHRHDSVSNRTSLLNRPPLSQSDNYVQRWLARTEAEMGTTEDKPKAPQSYESVEHQHKSQKLQHVPKARRVNRDREVSAASQHKARRKHHSSDSSLLDAPMLPNNSKAGKKEKTGQKDHEKAVADPPRQPNPSEKEKGYQKDSGQAPVDRSRKRHGPEPSVSGSSVSAVVEKSDGQGIFEKRKRHKTREDRYEPKDKTRDLDKEKEKMKKPRRKKAKRGDASEAARRAGEDLMRNFSSKNVGNERLTIRPSASLGIFNNGRVSSSNPRRGLPDLAFSEMEFLRNSRHSYMLDDDPMQTTTHEKGRENRENLSKATSKFFTDSRSPLKERIDQEKARRSQSLVNQQISLDGKGGLGGRGSSRSKQINPRSMDVSDKSTRNFELSRSPDRSSLPRLRSLAKSNWENLPPPESRRSQGASTYISWSESQYEPLEEIVSKSLEYGRSPTPESVRISIEKTGIYKDTGIKSHGIDHHNSYIAQERQPSNQLSPPSCPLRIQASPKGLETKPIAANATNKDNYHNSEGVRHMDRSYKHNSGRPHTHVEELTKLQKPEHHVAIETCDSQSGWKRADETDRPDEPAATISNKTADREVKSTPISRKEIGKLARVKRPSTTQPVTRVAERHHSSDSQNTDKEMITSTENKKPLDYSMDREIDIIRPTIRRKESSATLTGDTHAPEHISKATPGQVQQHDLEDETIINDVSSIATRNMQAGILQQPDQVSPSTERLPSVPLNRHLSDEAQTLNPYGVRVRSLSRLANIGITLESTNTTPRIANETKPLYIQQMNPRNEFSQHPTSLMSNHELDINLGTQAEEDDLEDFEDAGIERSPGTYVSGPGYTEREQILETFQDELENISDYGHVDDRYWAAQDLAYEVEQQEPWYEDSGYTYGDDGYQSMYQQHGGDMILENQYPGQSEEKQTTSTQRFWQPQRQY